MDTDRVAKWTEKVLEDGAAVTEYLLTQEPKDSFGWGRILREMWTPDRSARPSASGLLLVGPPGCGKHTAVHHMVHLLAERNYRFVYLDGEELASLHEEPEALCGMLDTLLDFCYEEKSGVCLVLERAMQYPFSRALCRFLGLNLCRYYLTRGEDSRFPGPKDHPVWKQAEPENVVEPFFLILLEEEEPALPSLLRSRLQLCRMALPDEYRRRAFLMSCDLGGIRTNDGLLEKTEGLSYAQLEDLINSLRALTAADREADEEQDVLLREQLPPGDALARARMRALDSLAGLAEKAPALLENLHAVVPAAPPQTVKEPERAPVAEAIPQNLTERGASETEANRRMQLETMPVTQLVQELFDKERANLLLQN